MFVTAFGTDDDTLVVSDGANDFTYTFTTGALNKNITLAGEADAVWTLTGTDANVDAIMSIHTKAGATAECEEA